MEATEKSTIYWSLLDHGEWHLYIAATLKGLCFVGSQNESFAELAVWVQKHFSGCPVVENKEILQPYQVELIEYLEGRRRNFTISFDYHGTPFQLSVWNALCEIPYGQTKAYTDIANHINKPKAVRAVGAAIGANPVLITVPCHRVIGKNGSLTGYRGGLKMKTKLLELERSGA